MIRCTSWTKAGFRWQPIPALVQNSNLGHAIERKPLCSYFLGFLRALSHELQSDRTVMEYGLEIEDGWFLSGALLIGIRNSLLNSKRAIVIFWAFVVSASPFLLPR